MSQQINTSETDVVNDVLTELGIGKYQMITFLLIMVPMWLNIMSSNIFVFTTRDTSYRCLVPECESLPVSFEGPWLNSALPFRAGQLDKCRRYGKRPSNGGDLNETCDSDTFNIELTEACVVWVFENEKITIVKDFSIPCDDVKRSLVATLNSAGLMVNLLFSGMLSDNYGRRNAMAALMFSGALMGLLQSFSTNYLVFCAFEFLNLALSAGGYSICYVLVAEMLPPTKRIYGLALIEIMNSLSLASVGLIAWILPSWRQLLYFINTPQLLVTPLILFIVPESLRWLHAKGKTKECIAVYKRAIKINRTVSNQRIISALEEYSETFIKREQIQVGENSSFGLMFKSSRLLLRFFLTSFCWFISIFVYTGMILNSVNISANNNNIYLDFILVTLIELPSILVYLIFLRYTNRRCGLCLSYVGAGIFCIMYGLTNTSNSNLSFWLYLAGKMLVNTSLAMIYVYSSELFPTVLRSSAINYCYVFGGIGGIVSPQILLLNNYSKSYPMFIFGITSILALVALLNLPETKGRKMPDTLEEAEDI